MPGSATPPRNPLHSFIGSLRRAATSTTPCSSSTTAKSGNGADPSTRYSPGECIAIEKRYIEGRPDPAHVSTSYVERQNLTMRMSMRRFTRPTNAFSKKLENHAHSVTVHFMHYNFCRIHQSLRVTPAMEAGITDRLWELGDIVDMVEAAAPKPNRPARDKKRAGNSN